MYDEKSKAKCGGIVKMNIYDFSVKDTAGVERSMSAYKGQILLIVNTATKCGFTPQLRGLEQLYQTYKDQGFIVLGFPCNQFMNQEPVADKDMVDVCERNFGVTFPLFAKVCVNGEKAHPLFNYLKSEQKGLLSEAIKWNFTKFLINSDGRVVKRYGPNMLPIKIEGDIKKLLMGHAIP